MNSSRSLTVRQLQVDPSLGFPRHWHSGDAYKSHLYNSLSMWFPRGEQYLTELIRGFIPALKDAQQTRLLDEVQIFVGQEATHRRMHEQYNRTLADQGYRNRLDPIYETRMNRYRGYSSLTQLALAAAYEHLTAAIGDGHLRNAHWTDGMFAPVKSVWDWHAAEESEHKAVVFDVYRWAGGGYWRRAVCSAWVDLLISADLFLQTAEMLRQDRVLFSASSWASALSVWFGRKGLAWHLLPRLARYFLPGFHPWQDDNAELIENWKQRAAGDYRALRSSGAVQDAKATGA